MYKPNSSILNHFHRFYFLGIVFLLFGIYYPLLRIYRKDAASNYSNLIKARRWIGLKSAMLGRIRFKVEIESNLDDHKNYIICANHTSNLDIIALMAACNFNFSFIGKEELLNNWVTSMFFKTVDIPVNRASKISSFRAFKQAESFLINGKSIAIFPEGMISGDFPPKLGAFKTGAFKLAKDTNTPILPVIIHDIWKLCWDDGAIYGTRPGACKISILSPIEPESFADTESLKNKVYEVFLKNW